MASQKNPKDDNYTDPSLRERLKEEIKAGDKGGKPGQWSARKSQLLTHEYEKAGGGYKHAERTDSQKHLKEWTSEKWTTRGGLAVARADGTHRYLPKEAWDKLSPAEQKAADKKKQEGDHKGHQHVANTKKATEARKEAAHQGKQQD